jgi:hypothetical protein
MAESGRSRQLLRGGLFVAMGLLLIATSAPDRPVVMFDASVEVPQTVLDNSTPRQQVVFRFSSRGNAAPRVASVDISLRATHSDAAPQLQSDNTPWVSASVTATLDGAAGAPALTVPQGAGSPFLEQGGLFVDEVGVRDADGHGELRVQLERAITSEPITTRVSWGVRFSAELPAPEPDQRELPWDIEVLVDGGAP